MTKIGSANYAGFRSDSHILSNTSKSSDKNNNIGSDELSDESDSEDEDCEIVESMQHWDMSEDPNNENSIQNTP